MTTAARLHRIRPRAALSQTILAGVMLAGVTACATSGPLPVDLSAVPDGRPSARLVIITARGILGFMFVPFRYRVFVDGAKYVLEPGEYTAFRIPIGKHRLEVGCAIGTPDWWNMIDRRERELPANEFSAEDGQTYYFRVGHDFEKSIYALTLAEGEKQMADRTFVPNEWHGVMPPGTYPLPQGPPPADTSTGTIRQLHAMNGLFHSHTPELPLTVLSSRRYALTQRHP